MLLNQFGQPIQSTLTETPTVAPVKTPTETKARKNDKDFMLQFPDGEFTHTELARFNGKTNQQVWSRYDAALKSGLIVRVGQRKLPEGQKSKGMQPYVHVVNKEKLALAKVDPLIQCTVPVVIS